MGKRKKVEMVVPTWREGVKVLDEYRIPGKRMALSEGVWMRVKGRTGEFKVVRIDEWPSGQVEVLTWWNSSRKDQRPKCGFYTLDLGRVVVTRVGM